MKKILGALLAALAVLTADAEKMEIECVLESDEIQLDSVPMGIVPGAGLAAIAGSNIVTIDPEMPKRSIKVELPDTVVIDDFVMCGTAIVMKIYDSIVWTSASYGFFGLTFENPDFSICEATDSTIYVLRDSTAIELNIASRKPVSSYKFDDRPQSLHKLSDGVVAVLGRRVVSLYGDEWTLLHEHPCDIRSAAITPKGIFLGTDDGLWRVEHSKGVQLLLNGTVSMLFFDNSILYLVDGEGNLYRITWV